jgi:hypothetical protein
MTEASQERLEQAKKRLADIERRIGPFMPKITIREGIKRTEWRHENTAVRTDQSKKKKAK